MKKLYLFFAVLLCSILGTQTAKANIVYCDNNKGWSAVYAYLWTTGSNGTHYAMTNVGDNLWALSYSSKNSVIFESSSSWANQTANLTLSSNSQLFQADGTDKGTYSWKLTIGGSTTTMTFNSSTNKYTATVTLTGSGTLKIADNLGWYTFVGSSSLADNSSVTSKFSTTASSHTLSAGEHTITWDPLNKKISDSYTPPVTSTTSLTGITLTDGNSEYSFTGSGTTWSLASTEVTVGNTFTIVAEYTTEYTDGTASTTETKTYTTSSTIASGSACSLSEGTTGFSLGFKQISATLTASDEGVPTSVTFTNVATETSRSLTGLTLHKSGGSGISLTKASDTQYTLTSQLIDAGKNNSYYIVASYDVEMSDGTSATDDVEYVLPLSGGATTVGAVSGTNYSLVERSSSQYFYFNYSNYLTTNATVTLTDGVPSAVTFTEVESQYIIEEEEAIITLRDANGNVVGTFTKTDDTTYSLSKTSIAIASTGYKIGYQASSDASVTYYAITSGSGYWISQQEYSIGATSNTFIFGSTAGASGQTWFSSSKVVGTVTLSDSGVPSKMLFTQFNYVVDLDESAWSVTASSSEPAVFLVGDYFNNWRVTPEYQLTKNADGVYELKNFVIYPDTEFQIRVYTSATSYTSYGKTADTTYWLNSWNVDDIELNSLESGKQNLDWKLGQTMIASLTFNNSTKDLNIDIDESKPSTYSSAPIKGVPYVALVGSKFTQGEKFTTPNSGRIINNVTMKEFSTNTAWQDGWIQYTADGKLMVYGDGYNDGTGTGAVTGRAIYNTIWPPRNPISFDNEGWEFSSTDIEFRYVETRTKDSKTYAVYEIPYVWMDGQYKIWTGWGGQMDRDYQSDCTDQLPEWRSHYNWGCGEWSGDNSTEIKTDTFYKLNGKSGNSAGGNFNFDKAYYFSKVEFWYNLTDDAHGTQTSMFIGYLANGDPIVSIERTGKAEVTGDYKINSPSTDGRGISSWEVTLYKVNEEGGADTAIKTITGGATNSNSLSGTMVVDALESGLYYYKMTVNYPASGDVDAETLYGESTRVRIYGVSMPDECEAVQITETVDGTTLYSFDVKLTANAPTTLNGVKVTDGNNNEVEVLSLVDYYVIGIPRYFEGATEYPFSTLYTVAYSDGTTWENGNSNIKVFTSATDLEAYLYSEDLAKYTFDKHTYIGVVPDDNNNYAMPTITFKNVIPRDEAYDFYVSMGNKDGDALNWEDYNVVSASAYLTMVKPVVAYSATGLTVEPIVGNAMTDYDMPTLGQRNDQPIQYTNTNMVSTTGGKLTQLAVTNDVLNNWKVTYTLTTSINENPYVYSNADMQGKVLNGANGVDADFEYLPISYETAGVEKTGITTIDNYQSKIANGADIVVSQIAVGYKRAVTGYETTTPVYGYNTEVATLNLTAPKALAAYDDASATYAMQWEDRWNGQNETADKYSNAFAAISFTPNTALNDVAGYYSSNSVAEDTENANNWMAVDPYGNVTKFPAAGGVVIDQTNSSYSSKYLELGVDNFEIGNVEKNYAEGVANVGKLPIKIWHVGDGSEKPTGTLYTLLTADYPIVVKPAFKAAISDLSISTAAVEDGVAFGVLNGSVSTSMTVLSYPTLLNADLNDMTTGIEDVVADGDGEIRIYPNPAVDVVTVAGSAALGTVEIYSLDGRLVKVVEAEDYSATIAVGDLAKGTYVVRAGGMTERMIKM